VFPVSQTAEDALTVSASERALAFEHGLGAGDVIFVDPLAVNALDRQIVRRLCREHDFEPLERTSAGVTALRLHPPGSPAGVAWCAAHFTPFIQGPDGTTYVVDLGTRRRLPDPETLRRYAGVRPSVADVRVLNDRDLARIPEGPPLDSALSGPIFAHDLMYAYQVTDDGQLLRLPNAATAAARGLKADASNMIVVLDDLFRFTPMPILRHYGVVIGDARTAPLVKGYQVEPGSSRLADLVVTPFVGIAPREGP
jgi:hypothetical protein